MKEDPRIAIVQTPQFFRATMDQSWVERGAGSLQEIFYRFIQVSNPIGRCDACIEHISTPSSSFFPHSDPENRQIAISGVLQCVWEAMRFIEGRLSWLAEEWQVSPHRRIFTLVGFDDAPKCQGHLLI